MGYLINKHLFFKMKLLLSILSVLTSRCSEPSSEITYYSYWETTPFVTLDEDTFEDEWNTRDDRVMGGESWSYTSLDQGGFGIFNGTAVGEGGGFSLAEWNAGEG